MRVLDPAALAAARATAKSTLTGAIEILGVGSVAGEFSDNDDKTVLRSYPGRMRLIKATEIPEGMSVEGREAYEVTLPPGAIVDASNRLRVGSETFSVVGVSDAPLGGEIIRRVYAERV